MLDEFIVEQLETDLVASLDIHVGLRPGARGALVASEIVSISRSDSPIRASQGC